MAKAENPRAVAGDNSEKTIQVDASHLKAFVERIENMEEEKRTILDDIKEIYAEAKGTGYDAKIIRRLVACRRKDRQALMEEQQILALYAEALGMDVFG